MHAVNLHNYTPCPKDQHALFTLFTNEDAPLSSDDFRVFRSSVYILDSSFQTGTLGPGNGKYNPSKGSMLVTPSIMQAM